MVDELLVYATQTWLARGLPWRVRGEPLVRQALVEGLLAQTRAEAVADAYMAIFGDVETVSDWAALAEEVRRARVAPLGLPLLKLRAVDGIARVLLRELRPEQLGLALEQQVGIGPYTAGMVALLFDAEAAPVDCNVDRVAGRVDPAVAPAAWIAEVVAAARRAEPAVLGYPNGYVAVSAVLDVGATRCAIGRAPRCAGCPFEVGCAYAARGPRQMEMWR